MSVGVAAGVPEAERQVASQGATTSASVPVSLLWGGSGVPGIQIHKKPCVQEGEGPSVSWAVFLFFFFFVDFSTVFLFLLLFF